MIQLNNLSFQYDEDADLALNNISLLFKQGEWTSIVGANGSGKSTLAKIVMGIHEGYDGEIIINDTVVTEDNLRDVRKKFSIVLQNPDNQFVGTTVEDDIAFSLENLQVPREEMVRIVDAVLEEVNMTAYKKHEPSRLSGGQKQRVAIAGALATDPEVLILDEATSMLDPEGRRDVLNLIKRIHQERGTTIIYITHDLNEIEHSDTVVVMNNGVVKLKGNVTTIYASAHILEENNLVLPFEIELSQRLLNQSIISYSKLVLKL